MDDELLDLVNRADEVIGTINRQNYEELLNGKDGYIRAADMFLVNSAGEVYVPTRPPHKTIAPNGYDFSAGGHVASGENYAIGLLREVEEELNLHLNEEDVELIDKSIFDDIRYIRYLYVYRSDETPTFNPDDFVTAEWMTPEKLIAEIDNGHPAKMSLKLSIELLQDYLAL